MGNRSTKRMNAYIVSKWQRGLARNSENDSEFYLKRFKLKIYYAMASKSKTGAMGAKRKKLASESSSDDEKTSPIFQTRTMRTTSLYLGCAQALKKRQLRRWTVPK
jgi:hypothetical protein